ncbi:hypothetical protein ACQ4PT_010954 [Festuca glaucescens]
MAEPVAWRPQLSGQGIEEQIAAAEAMIDLKDADDPVREMAAQGLEDLENMPFPPSKRIQDLVEFHSINLKKKGVNVSFIDWEGEAEPFEEFQEVWVSIMGIPAKWLTWKTICQVSTALGVLVNIDWHCIFRSFYKIVRVKVAVRDISKIPTNKLFEMEQGFFLIDFKVEEMIEDGGNVEDGNDDDEDQQDDGVEEGLGDDFVDHINKTTNGGESRMDTDASTPTPSSVGTNGNRTVTLEMADRTLEMSVMKKVMENEKLSEVAVSMEPRTVEENIGVHLLQQFDEETDEERDDVIPKGKEVMQIEDTPMVEVAEDTILTKSKQAWGPVQATRMSSRIQRDGRKTIEKAQEIKKSKEPRGSTR